MAASNHLNSHCPESSNRRADKMAPDPYYRRGGRGWGPRFSKQFHKHFYGKKRRAFLNNPEQWPKSC